MISDYKLGIINTYWHVTAYSTKEVKFEVLAKAEEALSKGVPENDLPQDQREALQRSRELGLDELLETLWGTVTLEEFINGSILLGIEIPGTILAKKSDYLT